MVLLAAVALTLGANDLTERKPIRQDEILVTHVSPDPGVTSGILFLVVRVTGRSGARARNYFVPFMAAGQPRPPVGAQCAVRYRWSRIDALAADNRPVHGWSRVVVGFRCKPQMKA